MYEVEKIDISDVARSNVNIAIAMALINEHRKCGEISDKMYLAAKGSANKMIHDIPISVSS